MAEVLDFSGEGGDVMDFSAEPQSGGTFAKILSAIGAPGRAVQSGVNAVGRGAFGVSGSLGDVVAPAEMVPPPGESVRNFLTPSRGTVSERLKAAAIEVPTELVNTMTGATQAADILRREQARGGARAKLAGAGYGASGEIGSAVESMALDPITAIPVGAIGNVGRGVGRVALRGLSGAMSLVAGAGAVEGIGKAYQEWKTNGITPALGQLLADAAMSGGMAAVAGWGATGGAHPQAKNMMEEMRASLASERLKAIQEGRAPDPAVMKPLEILRDDWVNAQQAERLRLKNQKLKLSEDVLDFSKEEPPQPVINLSQMAKQEGRSLVNVDVGALDKGFQKDIGFYINQAGENRIPGRYEAIQDAVSSGAPLNASEVVVHPDGKVGFVDGRHRFAYLRDQGISSLPVAMDAESLANATRHGYVASAPAPKFQRPTLPREPQAEGVAAYVETGLDAGPPPPISRLTPPPAPAPKFQKPTLASPDRSPVLVDLEKFDQAWAKSDPNGYLAATDESNLKRMLDTINDGKPIEMPEAKLADGGGLMIDDGRQRLAALRDLGVKRAQVMVPTEDLPTIQRHYSPELDPIPLADYGPFVKPGMPPELVLDLPPAEYVKRLPPKPEADTPYRAIQNAKPGEIGGKPNAAYLATHSLENAVGKIHPAAQEILQGMLNDKEVLQSRVAARMLEGHRELTRAEADSVVSLLESRPRDQLSGGLSKLGRALDDIWDYSQSVPEAKALADRLGIRRLDNFAPHILKTPLTRQEKISMFSDELLRRSQSEGNPLTQEQALAKAAGQAAAAVRWADNQIQLSGSLTHHRFGTDRPIRQDMGALYSYGQRAIAHTVELKWLGENRSKLTNPEGTGIIDQIRRPLTNEESLGMSPGQIAETNKARARAGDFVENAFDMVLGKDYGLRGKAWSALQQAYSLLAMVRSAPIQLTTTGNTALWGGSGRALKSGLGILFSKAKRESALLEAMRSGATHPNFSGEFGSIYGGGKFMWGVGETDKWMRVLANDVGRRLIDDARQGNANALARLQTQGFFRVANQQGIARLDALQPNEVNYDLAAKTFSDFTQFRTDAAHTAAWTNTPETRALMQFIRFPSQQGVFLWKAARHAVVNRDPGVFIRLIPVLMAVGVGTNTVKRLMADTFPGILGVSASGLGIGQGTRDLSDVAGEFERSFSDDAEEMGNTLLAWKKNPDAFFGKIMSARGVPIDREHPETVVAATLQALVNAGVMGAYETVFDRTTGKPEEAGGATFGAVYRLVDALQSTARAGLSLSFGNTEAAGKELKSAAKKGLSALGPYGQEAAREFLGDALPEHGGLVGAIHEALVAGISEERKAQGQLNRAKRSKTYQELALAAEAPEKIKAPPKEIETKTAEARIAAETAKQRRELVRMFKLGQVEAAKDRARELNGEWRRKFKVKKPTFFSFVRELEASQSRTPEAIEEVMRQFESESGGD